MPARFNLTMELGSPESIKGAVEAGMGVSDYFPGDRTERTQAWNSGCADTWSRRWNGLFPLFIRNRNSAIVPWMSCWSLQEATANHTPKLYKMGHDARTERRIFQFA